MSPKRRASGTDTAKSGKSASKRRLLETFAAAATAEPRRHPHLSPVNGARLQSDCSALQERAGSLLAYRRFLSDARAVKAQGTGTSAAFERNVLAQARQARDDLHKFTGTGLRLVQQLNHTDVWSRAAAHATKALRQTGPRTLAQMWGEIAASDDHRVALAKHGLTDDMVAEITNTLAMAGDATAGASGGKPWIELSVAGEQAPRRITLTTSPQPPSNLSQLLEAGQFDRVLAAMAAGQPLYLAPVPTANPIVAYEPADLAALGAVAANERMHQHVRALEDNGLATYAGNDPATDTVIALLVVAIFLAGTGALVLYLCDSDNQVKPPDWECTAGEVLLYLGLTILGAFVIGFFVEGGIVCFVGFVAFDSFLPTFITHFDLLFPDFVPGHVYTPPTG